MFRNIRITSQVVFFFCFSFLLFYFNNNNWAHRLPTEIFLQLNPLVALLTSITARKIIFAVVPGAVIITVITILFGRIFCGFICPLGSAIDFTDKYLIGKARHESRRPHIYIQRLKYVLLIALVVLSFLGILLPQFMDPISIATRIVTVIVDPALHLMGFTAGNMWIGIKNVFTEEKIASQILAIAIPGTFATLLIFTAVFIGGFWDKRFWCQYVCPTGALLGLLSRFPLLRRNVVDDKCNSCRVCAIRQCPTRSINHDNVKRTNTSECILCGVCEKSKRNCTQISIAVPKTTEISGPSLARRHFVTGIIAGVITPTVIRGTGIEPLASVQPIRPPGSIPENEFLTRCIACGECMKACPNHALRPCGFSDGLMKLNTPRLSPIVGYCEPSCTACTLVCPTVAIRPVPVEDKPFIKIGTAIVNKEHCLAWRGEIKCLVCKNHCPYQAIGEMELVNGEESSSGPSVDKDLCTGCGVCEKYCANTSNPAIRVYAHGERRISKGPFISEKKREKISKLRKEKE
jgi:polyferredoxin